MNKKAVYNIFFILICIANSFDKVSAQTFDSVRNVFITKCAICHNADGQAPFQLTDYDDIKRRAALIKDVIESDYMPPWQPDSHYRDFANNRSLSKKEKELIIKWIAAGTRAGTKKADTAVKNNIDNANQE